MIGKAVSKAPRGHRAKVSKPVSWTLSGHGVPPELGSMAAEGPAPVGAPVVMNGRRGRT